MGRQTQDTRAERVFKNYAGEDKNTNTKTMTKTNTKTDTKTKKGARARWGSNNCAGGHIRFDKRMYTTFLKQTRFLDFKSDCQNCKSSNVAKI